MAQAPTQTVPLEGTVPPTQVQSEATPAPDISLQGAIPDVDVLDVLEVPEAFQGTRSVREVSLTPEIRHHLGEEGYSAVTDGSGRFAEIKSNGPTATLCMVPIPEGRQDVQGIIPFSRYPASVTCLLAVDMETGEYSVLLVSDRQGEANIEGEMSATFDGAELVWSETHASLMVDGEEQRFEMTEGTTFISSERLLANSEIVIDVEAELVGGVRYLGDRIELDYPNISIDVEIALHSSAMTRAERSDLLSLVEIHLNEEYWDAEFGEGAVERQILFDVLRYHHKAWQYENDGEFYDDREEIDIIDFLDQLNSGNIEGEHALRLRVFDNSLLPEQDSERIFAEDKLILMITGFNSTGEDVIGGVLGLHNYIFDPTVQQLLVVHNEGPKKDLGVELPSDPNEANDLINRYLDHAPYSSLMSSLAPMAFPEKFQWGYVDVDSEFSQGESAYLRSVQNLAYELVVVPEDPEFRESPLMGRWSIK